MRHSANRPNDDNTASTFVQITNDGNDLQQWLSSLQERFAQLLPHSHMLETLEAQDEGVIALRDMLFALKASQEAYLPGSLEIVDVVIPHDFDQQDRDSLSRALRAANLNPTLNVLHIAAEAASRGNGIGACYGPKCGYENMPLRLVLAIDYSRAALTTTLLAEEAALFDVQRVIRNASLGADEYLRTPVAPPDYWDSIRAQLRYVTGMPVSDPYVILPATISQLVLLGDRATDPQLADAIKDVMGSSVLQTAPSLRSGADVVDPVFAAALGEAALSKFKIDLGEGECKPAWYCGWGVSLLGVWASVVPSR